MNEIFRVLVVDDNQDLAVNLQDILDEEGYETRAAFDGKSALEICADETFDLLLVDYKLPDMDGLLLQERLSEFTDSDFIVITGHAALENAAAAVYRKQIVGYETKPINMERLLAFIKQIRDRRRAEKLHKKAEAEIRASLKEKETLLREIHHRVKNNMTAIASLIQMQADKTDDPRAVSLFKDLNNRVMSMMFVHEELYESRNLSHIDFNAYLDRLVFSIYQSFARSPVNFTIHAENIFLDTEKGFPCGLIVAELVTNAFKHSFPDDSVTNSPEITVEVGHVEGEYTLTVRDNGVGLPEGFDVNGTKTLGMQLVKSWAEHQLGGKLEVESSNGAKFTIRFGK